VTPDKTGPTLVVLAAGLGSRFGGLKQLKPLGPGGNVLLEYTVFDAIRASFRNIIFIIQTPFAEDFTSLVSSLPSDVSVEFAFQDQIWPASDTQHKRTKPWGTGHALLAAQDLVHGPFVMCNADDYYGTSAFERAAEFLDGHDPESVHYGLLGYRLDATLSGHGNVSRALCTISDKGCLTSVAEHPKIKRKDGTIVSEVSAGEELELNEDDRVSMNFWMLTQSVFRFLDIEVKEFIERYRQIPGAECRLPDIIDCLTQRGDVTVECVPHDDEWFGLTRAADYENAVSTIQALHDGGTYPTPLWKDDA
jgi:NDP-sugar pyrophosphorylase family protein